MKTIVSIEGFGSKKLSDLDKGDWFKYEMPDSSEVLAIKGDDTVYDGEKVLCMRVNPSCGTIARLGIHLPVEHVEMVKVVI